MSDDTPRGPLDRQPDEPGWWQASDAKWYPPETAQTQTAAAWPATPPGGNKQARKPGWFGRNRIALVVGVVAFILGITLGAASMDKSDDVKELKAANARLQQQVNDHASAQAADDAHARAVDADRRAAAEKAAADKKAAAEQAAADKKAAAEKAAAEKKAAAEAKAAAAAKAAAKAKAEADAKAAADAAAAAAMNTVDSDGVREVGVDINPGRWKTAGGSEDCYYAILNSSDTSDIADNNITGGPATVDLAAGQFFETTRCATWTRVG